MAGRYICITKIAAFIIAIYGIFSYMNATWLISGQMNNNSHAKMDLKRSHSFMEEEWMQSRSQVYEERRKRVERVCANLKNHWVMKNPGNELIVDVNNGLGYCRQPKVGTSTWLTHFLTISKLRPDVKNKLTIDDKHNVLPGLLYIKGQGNFEQFTDKFSILTFSFVRHPFARIISAYEDKILSTPKGHLSQNLKKTYNNTSWPSFVTWILDTANHHNCFTHTSCNIDVHIRPFYHRCSYCDIRYDVISLMEEFDEDFRYIISKQNVTLLLDKEKMTVNKKQKNVSESVAQRISKYFSMLEESVRLDLYNLYKIDFELFGYEASKFL